MNGSADVEHRVEDPARERERARAVAALRPDAAATDATIDATITRTRQTTPRAAPPPPAPARRCSCARPVPSSRPASCVSRGTMSMRQQKRSASRGAVRIQRFSGGLAPKRRAQARQRVVQERRAGRAVVLEALAAPSRREHERVLVARRVRARQHGLVVDRDDAVAAADLLLDEVLEQVAAHRAHGMGAEALALARDARRHEAQREELRMGMRLRRARPRRAR